MATIVSHFLVGWSAYRFVEGGTNPRRVGPLVAGALAVLPDVDSLFMRAIPYGSPWGHRGMTHSLAFAALVGVAVAALLHRRLTFPGGFAGLAATLFCVTASHGVLDAMTDGGHGVAFFAPFNEERHFLPIRPIPVSPITVNPFDSDVLRVIAWEWILIWPWALLLATIRRPLPRGIRWATFVGVAVSAFVWIERSVR